MKRLLCSLLTMFMAATVAWADVVINETNFPDENFRSFLLSQEYGADGIISSSELVNITSMNVYDKSIQDLKGIEYFTALKELECGYNQLTALDVSKNTALTILYCYGNRLTSINISGCTKLEFLSCHSNQLTSLDVSNNTTLTTLYCYGNRLASINMSGCTALGFLSCFNNQLASLDVSGNTALRELYCYRNQLRSLDVSNNTALTNLECFSNFLTSLDVSKNTALKELYCYDNKLISLNVSGCNTLLRLSCYLNQISGTAMEALTESLPTASNSVLYVVYYEGEGNVMTTTQVETAQEKGWIPVYTPDGSKWYRYAGTSTDIQINESNFPDTEFRNWVLSQDYGQDGVLTEEEIANITDINIAFKDIMNLKGIEYFTELTELRCNYTQLTSLDVTKNTKLTYLGCYGNQLTSLNVSGCSALTSLDCYGNKLTSVDVTGCTALTSIFCSRNQLNGTAMDTFIRTLPDVDNGEMKVIDDTNEQNTITIAQVNAAKAKGWTPMYCYDYEWYEITSEDIEINTTNFPDENFRNYLLSQPYGQDGRLMAAEIQNIKELAVNAKDIQDLKGVELFTELKTLECYDNKITSLDLSGLTKLEYVYGYKNQLTSLNVSGCTVLKYLSCYCNQLKDEAMDALVESLPVTTNGVMLVIYSENEYNVMTTTQVAAAKAKGWTPKYEEWDYWKDYAGSEPSVRGDVNGDGEVNVGDLVCVSNFMAGDESVSKDAADVNKDGEVNVGDMVVISNIMSGNEE